MEDVKDLIKKKVVEAEERKVTEAVLGLIDIGLEREKIAAALNISLERVNKIIDENRMEK